MARGRADSMDLDDDYVPPVAHVGNLRRSSVLRNIEVLNVKVRVKKAIILLLSYHTNIKVLQDTPAC
jgi:hypothetical protein